MITIKLAIKTEHKKEIIEYQKQYSNCFHVYFNRLKDDMSQTQCEHLPLNNINLLDSWFKQSCVYEANALLKSNKEKIKRKLKKIKKNLNLNLNLKSLKKKLISKRLK